MIPAVGRMIYGAEPVSCGIGAFGAAVALLGAQKIWQWCGCGAESVAQKAGRWALMIPQIRTEYERQIQGRLVDFQKSVQKKWAQFGEPICTIPEEGWSDGQLQELLQRYADATARCLKDKQLSGTIYSNSLQDDPRQVYIEEAIPCASVSQEGRLAHLARRLETIFTEAFRCSYLWNSLHSDEFGVGAFIEYQVVQMAAQLFGGKKKEVMGFVTSGGSESLMTAMKSYAKWGAMQRGHRPGESVIIAPASVHASVHKAAEDYHIKLVLVSTDDAGRLDMNKFREAVKANGKKIVAIVGSAPAYPKGGIDPIREMANVAKKIGCGMHVDCCLGGFVVNFLKEHSTRYLSIPGVTSLSVDTHKNGWAPKGSSVLVTKKMEGGKNLASYSIYAIPDWSGGVYGTPKSAGSQSCVQALNALLAMLAIGKSGYREIAKSIHDRAIRLAQFIDGNHDFERLGDPEVNVVAFRIRKQLGLGKGATYAFAHEMAHRGFVLNTLRGDAVHFCVTGRFIGDPASHERFEKAALESLASVKELAASLKREGRQFSGDAGVYCALEAAMHPVKAEMSLGKYIENRLLGALGAVDSVKAYFLALLNPAAI